MSNLREFDTLVIGGGVVGMSIAYGLARAGERVCVLDQGDDAFRAARGNFGLVWVQGKGQGCPAYALWTLEAARQWPAFAQELEQTCGVDVELSQIGGLTICLDDEELAVRASMLETVRQEVGIEYPYEVLDLAALRQLSPHVGPNIAGAVFCPLDGHVSPLRLLRALVQSFQSLGGQMHGGRQIDGIHHHGGQFRVRAGDSEFIGAKLVLSAGLGNRALAPAVGLSAPVAPNRGQILVTERLQPFLMHPSLHVRQTGDGVVQIGDSKEDVGLDDGTTLAELGRIAARAVRCFPLLSSVNIVRTWGALRVMSPDGLPIYQASKQCPGAFVVSCHSGITLAAQHAGSLAAWVRGSEAPANIAGFTGDRFNV